MSYSPWLGLHRNIITRSASTSPQSHIKFLLPSSSLGYNLYIYWHDINSIPQCNYILVARSPLWSVELILTRCTAEPIINATSHIYTIFVILWWQIMLGRILTHQPTLGHTRLDSPSVGNFGCNLTAATRGVLKHMLIQMPSKHLLVHNYK